MVLCIALRSNVLSKEKVPGTIQILDGAWHLNYTLSRYTSKNSAE